MIVQIYLSQFFLELIATYSKVFQTIRTPGMFLLYQICIASLISIEGTLWVGSLGHCDITMTPNGVTQLHLGDEDLYASRIPTFLYGVFETSEFRSELDPSSFSYRIGDSRDQFSTPPT